jgi:hypothetical protein
VSRLFGLLVDKSQRSKRTAPGPFIQHFHLGEKKSPRNRQPYPTFISLFHVSVTRTVLRSYLPGSVDRDGLLVLGFEKPLYDCAMCKIQIQSHFSLFDSSWLRYDAGAWVRFFDMAGEYPLGVPYDKGDA